MVFNSWTFAAFLLVVLWFYAGIGSDKGRRRLLLIASCVFYGAWDWRFLGLMFMTLVTDWTCSLAIERSPASKRAWLTVSLCVNLGILGFFKYCNFFLDSLNGFFGLLGSESVVGALDIVLPVGISFYTFQSMSYTVDVFRGHLKACRNFWDYAMYVTFFPQLVAGPIVRARDFLPQIGKPHPLLAENVRKAIPRIMWGLVLKCVVADSLAPLVASCLEGPSVSTAAALLGALAFGVQIYGDFAGYSHIAIGLAQLFGYDLIENFNKPYAARDPRDFWRRWHISLSTWLRDYLYIPLGGSRQGPARMMRALFLTMVLGGLWHGASANFLLWGVFHGAWLIGHRLCEGKLRGLRAFPGYGLLSWGCTQYLVFLSWILFRVKDLSHGLDNAGAYLRVWEWNGMDAIQVVEAHPLPMTILAAYFLWQGLSGLASVFGRPHHARPAFIPLHVFTAALLLLWLTPEAASAFIYFQF